MGTEKKLKHLEFIQAVISRMAGNSFLLKGWSVALVAALFVLAAKDANKHYVIVAYLPVLTFWILDAFFVSQEKRFRSLYDHVRTQKEEHVDFSMDTSPFRDGKNGWVSSSMSRTLLLFYLPMLGIMVVIKFAIN